MRFAEAGIDSAEHDATELVLSATGMSRTDFFFARRERASDSTALQRLEAFASRRASREPLQHILGTAPMMGLELMVGEGVFVPRPETEILAAWAIDRLREFQSAGVSSPKAVDLCTGSGALALSLADACPQAQLVGVEIDDAALGWARKNVAKLQKSWSPQRTVRLIGGDATEADVLLGDWARQVHVLVSNPPYVPLSTEVSPEVRQDPHHAVFGGDDGLDVIRPLIAVSSTLLVDGGWVGLEHDDDSGSGVAELFALDGTFHNIQVRRDLAGRDRFTIAQRLPR